MKSKITIELDFDNGNRPVIQILARNSDDVRDKLIQQFCQSLHGSSWCRIKWQQDHIDHEYPSENFKRVFITTVPDSTLTERLDEIYNT